MKSSRWPGSGSVGEAVAGIILSLALLACAQVPREGAGHDAPAGDELERAFRTPPDAARPWVYWFWLNGNITREGITADLEAMQRVGIGGALIMEVDQGVPAGPISFGGAQWRALFRHAVAEADRLGLEINMNDDAGWNGSGGPWIRPEESMQKLVWSTTEVEGPVHFDGVLAVPETVAGYYRDVAVLAFPTPGPDRLDGVQGKALYKIRHVPPASTEPFPEESIVARERIVELSNRLDDAGRLAWDAPPGKWTIMRFGHTSTGVVNAPAPATGRGLECDKLAPEGIEACLRGLVDVLAEDAGPLAGSAFVSTHIDSWENGAQNWTARMRAEFRARRGYDLLPFLPVFSGRVVDGREVSERFLWDLRRTVSDLIVENYAGHAAELAHARGLRLSIEGYVAPCAELAYAGRADEPMGEFWTPGGRMMGTLKEMSSAAHTWGRPIVGAEAFTAGRDERWLLHPARLKTLGDRAFCDGINRFVFHRYAMQPWLERRPGMTMGPWGQHYERTQTWWEWTPAWHEYLARCQHMLRQGTFVADLCYLRSEDAPQGSAPHAPQPYGWDECDAGVVRARMAVEDGLLVLPDGMRYRLLVLPATRVMTPELLRRLRELVVAGASVVGPPPTRAPGLRGWPQSDGEVARLAAEMWGDCDGERVVEQRLGRGRLVWGRTPAEVLARDGVPPDFAGPPPLCYLHRAVGETDIYFVANPQPVPRQAVCAFRVHGKTPALWWPESGRMEPAPSFVDATDGTRVLLPLGPAESVFVVFRPGGPAAPDPVVRVRRDGEQVWSMEDRPPRPIVTKARYGVLDDPARTRDVKDKAQALLDAGQYEFRVARMAEGDDPAYGIVKTLILDYEIDGEPGRVRGTDPETVSIPSGPVGAPWGRLHRGADGGLTLEAARGGAYELQLGSGAVRRVDVAAPPAPRALGGPWRVTFPAGSGAPEELALDTLRSLSELDVPGVRDFSGTATYATTFDVPAHFLAGGRRVALDLGGVAVMARPTLNGHPLGTWWRPPYRGDVTALLRPGENVLEVSVVNLWPNRLIGDEALPEDSARRPNGTLREWPEWLLAGQPSPTGRLTFTTWRLWKKDDLRPPSGLLGPVRLEATALCPLD